MGWHCLRFLLISKLGIHSPIKDYLNQGLNISERYWCDGDSLLHQCLRGSVDSWILLFCLYLSEQREYWQSSIQPRLEWNLTCLYFKNQILMFLTQEIQSSMLKMKILDLKILIEYPDHILLVSRSILIPYHLYPLWKCSSFLSYSK